MNKVTFLSDFNISDDIISWGDESLASLVKNPTLKWMKFILTDDKPNGNKQRIPEGEFDNLIRTGINMPIKMAFDKINDGHEDSFPIGVITHLRKNNRKQIEGLAALWSKERPKDIEFLFKEFSDGKTPPQISWEIPFSESEVVDGIEDLHGVALRAATVVGIPAYEGRTPIVAMASKSFSKIIDKIDNDEDLTKEEIEFLDKVRKYQKSAKSNLEDNKVELEEVQEKLRETEATVTDLKKQLKDLEDQSKAKDDELTDLKSYKASVEEKEQKAAKIKEIKEKFSEAGLEKDEEYFEKNEELLLGLEDGAIDFMIQELVAFASNDDNRERHASKIPNFRAENNVNTKELAEALRARLTR
jgi:predicted  nucleic acid-binding Zn-ribbon protein